MTPLHTGAPRLRHRLGAALGAVALAALLMARLASAATTAVSDTVTSQNWSGYAAHGDGARFKYVSAHWRLPAADCVAGESSYSSFWVGIGGYSLTSTGLEQDGAELDCEADGSESVSAWYELLPDGPHTLSMAVRSGDLMAASVRIAGDGVTLAIRDLTRHESFTKTVRDRDIDATSAEWIAEAPSDCSTDEDCSVLPLADFGAIRFADADATTTQGVTSGIETSRWTTTKLLLGYEEENSAFIAKSTTATAAPTALTAADSQFEVRWSGTPTTTTTTTTPTTTTTTPTTTPTPTSTGTTTTGAGGSGGVTGTPGNPGGFGPGQGSPGGGPGIGHGRRA